MPDAGLVLETTYRDRSVFLRGLIPIYDAQQRKAGALFVLQDVTPLYRGILATQRNMLVFLVCMADDEVGRLEALLEQFRNLFVSTVRDYESASAVASDRSSGQALKRTSGSPG